MTGLGDLKAWRAMLQKDPHGLCTPRDMTANILGDVIAAIEESRLAAVETQAQGLGVATPNETRTEPSAATPATPAAVSGPALSPDLVKAVAKAICERVGVPWENCGNKRALLLDAEAAIRVLASRPREVSELDIDAAIVAYDAGYANAPNDAHEDGLRAVLSEFSKGGA